MDKNNNKFNKERNKFNLNPMNVQNYPYNKPLKRNFQQIPYEPNQIQNIPQNDEYSTNPPYPLTNIYPMQMPIPPNKDIYLKNPYKFYHYNPKKPFMQFPMQEYMGFPDNEMSLEDNGLIGNKKNKKRKNIIYPRNLPNNKKFMQFIPNINANNAEVVNNQNRANNSENNINNNNNYNENLPIPEHYFYNNNDYNNYYNNYAPKIGKKKAITVERNNNRNKNKRGFHKKDKKKEFENNINNNENDLPNYNNIRPFYHKKNYENETLSVSDLENNMENNNSSFSMDEEEEKEEHDINNKDNDDIIIIDNSSKEVIDASKIKLVEKKDVKTKIIPELDKMCSDKEIIEREKNRDIDRLEIDAKAFPTKKGIKERMVQKYNWRFGKKLDLNDPKEIRTIKAINQSIEYLIEQCLDCDKTKTIVVPNNFELTPLDIIPFIYDRFLAIYATIKLLSDNDKSILNDPDLLSNICKMIRTLIIFLNLIYDCYDEEEKISNEINNNINNLLIPLLDLIKEIIFNESDYEYNLSYNYKDEFLCYYLFIKIKKERNNWENIYNEIKSKLNKDEYTYKKIELVHNVYLSLKNKDYEKYINIIKNDENCDYFIACLMSLFFKEICVYGLQKISQTKNELTYKEIKDLLTFEEIEEVRYFLIWYGITKDKSRYHVNESDIVPITINNQNKKFEYDKAPQKTNKKFVEKKKGDKLRKDEVNKKIEFIKNENYKIKSNHDLNDNIKENISSANKIEEKPFLKNQSIIISDNSQDKSNQNSKKIERNIKKIDFSSNIKDTIKPNLFSDNKDILNTNLKNSVKLDESFMSKGSFNKLFAPTGQNNQSLTPKSKEKENLSKSHQKDIFSDDFAKPYSPKRISSESPKDINNNENKSLDLFSQTSISSIEPEKKDSYDPYKDKQTLDIFCETLNPAFNRVINDHKLNFIFTLKLISEKYKIKLDLIENYINRRKFFVFNELKKCCLNQKYSREYFKEVMNYKNNLNSKNTNENIAFKIDNKNVIINKKFELLTYDDIIYFLLKDFKNANNKEQKGFLNYLQINIYTTRDLIKSTKLLSGLKIKKNLIKENEDGTELTIINPNINLDSQSNDISFIMKFIFVDQIIDLESYIYDNQNNIQKYSILIPFFDIIQSDPENQQILTKFFTILDLGLGSYIKKDMIFFFVKRDIEQSSDLYQEYQNIQNDFIFNLTQKYGNSSQKNDIINVDEDLDNNIENNKNKRIIYLSPIDEFGKCYQEYIKYLNNKAFVELFENNKLIHLNSFNPKEVLIPFEKHIFNLNMIINHYINTIEEDLKNYLNENDKINYFFNKKLCIEILIGFVMCKILLIYYQNKCLQLANELYKIPFYNSNSELLLLENNLLNAGSILRQINLEGYDYLWEKCLNLDTNKIKDLFSFFDIFSSIICSYNLISDNDIQNYEYTFRKQYYDINIEKNNYEISKTFTNFFNKIMAKFFQNNNINIRLDNTEEIIEKIYNKNKKFLISTIAKIITNSDNLIFNENVIYLKGLEKFYFGLKNQEMAELNNNLNKKRKRKGHMVSNVNNLNNKKTVTKSIKIKNVKENKNTILNNIININESIDKSKDINNSIFFKDNGDISDDYYKYFRTSKKFTLPDTLI